MISRWLSNVAKWYGFRRPPSTPKAHAELQSVDVPEVVTSLPGMITPTERRWLYGYARSLWEGRGDLVDLGSWMGASSVSLAAGLGAAGRGKHRKVQSYDLFEWCDWMEPWLRNTPYEGRFSAGECFLPAFQKYTAAYSNLLNVHVADLSNTCWKGGNIEMLFVDAMKSWDTANGILRGFFPAGMPRIGLIAHQDFAHYYTSWIHLLMYRLRRWYEPIYFIPGSSTALFRCISRPPKEVLARTYSFSDFDEQEIDSAFRASASIVPKKHYPQIVAARAMLEVHRGDLDRASSLLADAEANGLHHPELELVQSRMNSEDQM